MPMPAPPMMKPGISAVQDELAVTAVIASSEPLTSSRPPPSSNRTGTRTLRRPAIGATMNESSVIGRKRRPACSAS